jgi:photosystem II stability/assembly factor-like uncharacterized protein
VYFNNQFVAVGDKGTIQISTDGLTWIARTSPASADLTSVVASGSELAAVGLGGTIVTSYDGNLWQVQQGNSSMLGPGYSLNGVASSGDDFIAVGSSGYILRSNN